MLTCLILHEIVQNFGLVLRLTMAIQDGKKREEFVVDLPFMLKLLRILKVGTLQEFDEN